MSMSKPTSQPFEKVSGLRKLYADHEALKAQASAPRLLRRKETAVPLTLDSTISDTSSIDGVIPGPDILWNPSLTTFRSRVDALAALRSSGPHKVPKGYPDAVEEPWVWSGDELVSKQHEYVVNLDKRDVVEIEEGLKSFKELGPNKELSEVTKATFPLPKLKTRLQHVALAVHEGIGFMIIRGLEPRKYTAKDNMIIYLGITSYVAEKRGCQDSSGNMIIHVKDLGYQIPKSEMRQSPYASNAQPFHNDVCDILAMYVQEQAVEGGESHLASCAKVYNEIAAERPDIIHTLAKPTWVFDKHKSEAFWNKRALLFNFDGKGPGFCFSRRPITGSPTSPRSPGVPPMSEIQAEAIDMVHFVGWKHKITLQLQRGDIQLINNLACQHARNGFVDKPSQRRHIIRLWLRNERLAWKTPEGLRETWFEKYGDSERARNAKWNINPGAPRERVLFRSDSCS